MESRLDVLIVELNEQLTCMGKLVEEAINMAISALLNKDKDAAEEAIAFDDTIDEKEKEIESLCLKLLLQQHPVAKDLRQISAALKMITDMERIGDQAADISEIVIMLADKEDVKKLVNIPNMARETGKMVNDSIEAYVKKDKELANKVIARDDVVDELFVAVKQDLVEIITHNIKNSDQAIDLLMIAKYFERIGDHATNIAEWAIFSIEGRY